MISGNMPKLNSLIPLERLSGGMPSSDESGAALRPRSGRPKLDRQFFLGGDRTLIPTEDDKGAGSFESNDRPNIEDMLQLELSNCVDERPFDRVGMRIMSENGEGFENS